MLKDFNVTYSYTIEASSFSFGFGKEEVLFCEEEYRNMGEKICEGLTEFTRFLRILPKRLQIKLEKEKRYKEKEKRYKMKNSSG